jgi:AcrR family transcriptional regulator
VTKQGTGKTTPKRGRRPADSGTREAILAAARGQLADRGYGSTTIRSVAAEAEVDPALVMHFFGSKDGLFTEVLGTSRPASTLVEVAAGGRRGVGERLTEAYFGMWESPDTSSFLQAIFRSVSSSPRAAQLVRGYLEGDPLAQLTAALGAEHDEARIAVAMSHLYGTALARYVFGVAPLAALSREELVALVAPQIQALVAPTRKRPGAGGLNSAHGATRSGAARASAREPVPAQPEHPAGESTSDGHPSDGPVIQQL